MPKLTLKWAFGLPGVTAVSAQPTVCGGRVPFGSETGTVFVLDAAARVTGVPASGGSIDGPGPTVAGGMVFTGSGYGRWLGRAGNVVLAFAVP